MPKYVFIKQNTWTNCYQQYALILVLVSAENIVHGGLRTSTLGWTLAMISRSCFLMVGSMQSQPLWVMSKAIMVACPWCWARLVTRGGWKLQRVAGMVHCLAKLVGTSPRIWASPSTCLALQAHDAEGHPLPSSPRHRSHCRSEAQSRRPSHRLEAGPCWCHWC